MRRRKPDNVLPPILADRSNPPRPSEQVLHGGRAFDLSPMLVLGREEDGTLYAAATIGTTADLLHLLEEFEHKLLSGAYGG